MHSIGEFKGNATLTLKWKEEDKYGLTFGVTKAKLILEHLEVIKKFVADNDKPKEAEPETESF